MDDNAKQLVEFLEQKQYAKAHALLNRPGTQLDDTSARACLLSGLHATPNLFRKILSRCPPKEYAGRLRTELTDKTSAWLTGTMLMLAAALGGHWDLTRELLSRGAVCDWNAPETRKIWNRMCGDDLTETIKKELGREDDMFG